MLHQHRRPFDHRVGTQLGPVVTRSYKGHAVVEHRFALVEPRLVDIV